MKWGTIEQLFRSGPPSRFFIKASRGRYWPFNQSLVERCGGPRDKQEVLGGQDYLSNVC